VQFDEGKNSLASGRLSEPLDGDARAAGYGLRREALSPMETLGQSIATVGPSLTPVVTIPLVGALAGNGTWLAYVLATIAIVFVAWCIGRFARYTSSPGSLYSYVTMILPPWLGATAGWSLFLAYVATGASNIGGFYEYANVLLRAASGHMASTVLLSSAMAGVTMWFAWRDVKISARLMLSMEALSVTLIVVIVVLVLVRHGLHGDPEQLHLHGMTGSGLRLGLVLAIFSFVGFESATTLGAEAREPLKTIPRAVIRTAILGGFFFTVCAYTEVVGLRMDGKDLATSDMPMQVLASVIRVPVLGTLIDIGALVALFSGVLACITAAARVLLLMAHNGLAHESMRSTHARNETPTKATVATGLAALIPVAVLAARGADGLDVYGWMGSLATYGFIVTYGLVCIALPRYLRDHHGVVNAATKAIPWTGVVAMLLALAGNLYPVPQGPYGKLPYIYLVYLFVVLMWFVVRSRPKPAAQENSEC
jgi:amino acid transporter